MENKYGTSSKIIALVVGLLVVQGWRELPGLTELLIGIVILIVCWYGRHWRMMFFVIGMIWMSLLASMRIDGQLPVDLEGQDLSVTGVINNLPQTDGRRTRFDFCVFQDGTNQKGLPERLRLSWYNLGEEIKVGQHWRFTVRLKQPRGLLNSGGFDYERWLFSQNIGATGYIRKYPQPLLLDEPFSILNYSSWRQSVSHYLDEQLQDSEFLGVIKALTIGDRQQITPIQWQLFRSTGTVHIVAISGLHIGLISGLVFFFVWKLSASLGIKVLAPAGIAALSAMIAATGYAALAGFSIPTQRALLMLLVGMTCVLRQRHHRPLTILALALLVVVVIDPFAVLSAGFWLSFLAVLIITFVLTGRLHKTGYWLSMLKVNGLISIGLAPLLIFFFQQFSLIAPIANFIAVPIISLWVAPLLLMSFGIAIFAPGLANLLLDGAVIGVQLLVWMLAKLADFDYANMILPTPSIGAVLLASTGCLLLFMPRGLPGRWLGVMLLLPVLFIANDRPAHGQLKLTLLDVGQGLSTVVQTTKHTLVYDVGARYSTGFDMGESVVLPFLRSEGIKRIDMLMISHGDNDHIGGAQSLLQQAIVDKILTSVPNDITNAEARMCQQGQTWVWDGVVFTVLSPSKQRYRSENNNSCVLKIESRAGVILLTGDIEQAAESYLVSTFSSELKADIMIAPHHGSNTSSSLAFLQTIQPKMILIPAGYRNRFGFPDRRVLDRYRKLGINWLNVAETGALTAAGNEESWKIDSYRNSHGKYWNQ